MSPNTLLWQRYSCMFQFLKLCFQLSRFLLQSGSLYRSLASLSLLLWLTSCSRMTMTVSLNSAQLTCLFCLCINGWTSWRNGMNRWSLFLSHLSKRDWISCNSSTVSSVSRVMPQTYVLLILAISSFSLNILTLNRMHCSLLIPSMLHWCLELFLGNCGAFLLDKANLEYLPLLHWFYFWLVLQQRSTWSSTPSIWWRETRLGLLHGGLFLVLTNSLNTM